MNLLRDLWAALITSVLIGGSLWLLSLSSDNLTLRELWVLVTKFAVSYCFSVLVLHVLVKRRREKVGPPSWLFVSIMGSVLYAAGITWTSMKLHLKLEPFPRLGFDV